MKDKGAPLRGTGSRPADRANSSVVSTKGFDPARMVSREGFVFTRPGQVARLILADGFRFVMFISGSQPKAFPITEQGEWEIDIPALLAKGKYPVVVTTVDAAHVKMIEALPISAVNEMIAAIATEARRAETTGSVGDEGAGRRHRPKEGRHEQG